ncbi:MAG: hypothetical protein LBD75_02750 [Candidatus Peribacteria bacterium]|nr:hypothetical protein [Candidatus Peribacteria bacterium]
MIGIKEKEGHQYQLDILIGGGELSIIKEFLEDWGIVIVSLDVYEQPIETFGKIRMIIPFKGVDFSVITFSDTLEKSIRYAFALGLQPKHVEMTDNTMTDEEILALITKIAKEYEQQQKQWEQQQTLLQQKEIKKYENKDIKHALKVINSNIDRIEQLLFIGRGILSAEEMKTLTNISNELKKIRLGTNFNRMAGLLLDAQSHISASEDLVLKALDDKKFLIDRNSVITNIDVISQYASLIRAQEKFVLKKPLSTKESLYLTGKQGTILARFFLKDLQQVFTSLKKLLPHIVDLLEYFVLTMIIMISGFWLFSPFFATESDILSYLPVFGFLGLLLYGYNQCHFERPRHQILAFIVLIVIYFYGIILLKSTFAL